MLSKKRRRGVNTCTGNVFLHWSLPSPDQGCLSWVLICLLIKVCLSQLLPPYFLVDLNAWVPLGFWSCIGLKDVLFQISPLLSHTHKKQKTKQSKTKLQKKMEPPILLFPWTKESHNSIWLNIDPIWKGLCVLGSSCPACALDFSSGYYKLPL